MGWETHSPRIQYSLPGKNNNIALVHVELHLPALAPALYFPQMVLRRLSKYYDIICEQETLNNHVSFWDAAQSVEEVIDVQIGERWLRQTALLHSILKVKWF